MGQRRNQEGNKKIPSLKFTDYLQLGLFISFRYLGLDAIFKVQPNAGSMRELLSTPLTGLGQISKYLESHSKSEKRVTITSVTECFKGRRFKFGEIILPKKFIR